LAAILGLVLIFYPDKTLPMLANFMGGFWLVSGLMSLRWGVSGERERRLSLITGAIAVLAGLFTLLRKLVGSMLDEVIIIYILGGVIVLTGILHAAGGFRNREDLTRTWTWTSFVLGIFEIVLGGLLLASPLEIRSGVYLIATIWAFLGAFIILGDALRQRAGAKRLERTEGGGS